MHQVLLEITGFFKWLLFGLAGFSVLSFFLVLLGVQGQPDALEAILVSLALALIFITPSVMVIRAAWRQDRLLMVQEYAASHGPFDIEDLAIHLETSTKRARRLLFDAIRHGPKTIYFHEDLEQYSLKKPRKRRGDPACPSCGSNSWKSIKSGLRRCSHCGTTR